MESYHYAWLAAHPDRTEEWLRERLVDGFHVHHVDGDHGNDDPLNLILIDGIDHIRLHAGSLGAGIDSWRKKPKRVVANIDDAIAPIYHGKANDPRSWVEFAKTYHGGMKPDERIWSDISMGLQSKARAYARRNKLAWPPAAA